MNLQQIKDGVQDLVEDDGYGAELDMFINMTYLQAVNEPGIRIPSLKGLGLVTTVLGDNVTSLMLDHPSFSGKLLRCGDPTRIKIYESLEALFDDYQKDGRMKDEDGDVEAVAIEGTNLYYQRIPTEETALTIIYYLDPPELVDALDVPVHLPRLTHEEILVYGTAEKIANRQEDGIEGAKVNTMAYSAVYQRGIARLQMWLAARRKNVVRSVWDA